MTIDKQPRGLGDQIEKFTKATGIKKLVHWAFGDDCGCRERQEKLNKLFPRKLNPECLNEKEYEYLKEIKLEKFAGHTKIDAELQRKILLIYNRVFRKRQEFTSCASCIITIVKEMQAVLKAYKIN
jgi:hypothetical protein|tara:strand:- start:15 stop:392 length:378 start_codon:yes stop_codon:yes gene_type:complete